MSPALAGRFFTTEPPRKPRRRMDTWIHMAEPFHCPPETVKTLLIGYTPNKKFKGFKKRNARRWWEIPAFLLFSLEKNSKAKLKWIWDLSPTRYNKSWLDCKHLLSQFGFLCPGHWSPSSVMTVDGNKLKEFYRNAKQTNVNPQPRTFSFPSQLLCQQRVTLKYFHYRK